ncbi:hypothetical protein ACHAWX_002345, partial [Stephanocyclus meneghinianus]
RRPPVAKQQQQQQQQQQPPRFSRTPEEIPTKYRRTLILSHIPPHLTYRDLRHHFTDRHDATVDFCTIDRHAAEAYVKFREREDVLRIWEGGDAGLDGHHGAEWEIGLVAAGVKLKAIHYTNQVAQMAAARDDASSQLERKRSRDDSRWKKKDEDGGGMTSGGRSGRPHNGTAVASPNKASRYSDDYYATPTNHSQYMHPEEYNSQQHEGSLVHSFSHTSAPSHPSVRDRPHPAADRSAPNSDPPARIRHSTPRDNANVFLGKNLNQETPEQPPQIQIHSSQTMHEQPPPKPLAWHRNTHTTHAQRTAQTSTLRQKLSLLQKQETALQKQLTLQKKMLAVLRSKNHSKDDQSKKLREILTLQTRVMQLKRERMEGMKELDGLQGKIGVEASKMGWSGRKSLDRRTTVLSVEGFETAELNDEALLTSVKEHFSAFGSVVSVSVECTQTDETQARFALVKFANRADAERAKASNVKFNELTLTCVWHNPPPASAPQKSHDTSEDRQDETNPPNNDLETNEGVGADDIYNDVYDDGYEEDEGGTSPQYREEMYNGGAEYDEEDDEHNMVDYD